MKKKILMHLFNVVFVLFVSGSFLIAFEWPQSPVRASALFSDIRGDTFNNGIVFANPGEVVAAEEGTVIMMFTSDQSNMGWFESPLGNAVVVAHRNDMMSVYSNLVNIKVTDTKRNLAIGDVIGISGESAWNDEDEGAGFQIMDTKMQRLINPVVLMQGSLQSQRVSVVGVNAINRSSESFPLYNGAIFTAGAYTLYMDRPENGMIHSASVALNGEVKETINYDTLEQVGNTLAVYGNKSYDYAEIYPDNNVMRLSEILLARGNNTIEVTLTNVGGTETFVRYRISVN